MSLFNGERPLLDLRVKILRDHVHRMLVVEGDRTFQGAPRQVVSEGEFANWCWNDLDVDVYVVHLPEQAENAWEREALQRNAILEAIEATYVALDDKTVILISDIDEIPNPEKLREACRVAAAGEVAAFHQQHSYFLMNLVDDEPWFGTRAISLEQLRRTKPQQIRHVAAAWGQHVIEEGGWHFGWLGGNDEIRRKVQCFSHTELNRAELLSDSFLDYCVRHRVTMHNSHKLRVAPITSLPPVVRENQYAYREFLA